MMVEGVESGFSLEMRFFRLVSEKRNMLKPMVIS